MVLGHEPAGTVVATGAGVTGWSPGDRAALEPALYCYHCEYCRSGRHNICQNIRFLSTPGHPGFFSEFVDLPAANLLGIPKDMPMAIATLVEPLAVALHSMRFAAMGMGETAAVFGAGPIGLLTVACLRAAGASRIWVVEPVAHRREMANGWARRRRLTRARWTRRGRSSPIPAAGAWIAPWIARRESTPPTGPSAASATAGGWSLRAFTRETDGSV